MRTYVGFSVFLFVIDVSAENLGCSNPKHELLEWSGTQKTFEDFRQLSEEQKGRLRSFELSKAEDLDVVGLMDQIWKMPDLETIRLHNIELIGQFPAEYDRPLLPKIRRFDLELIYAPYPTQQLSCANYTLFTKSPEFNLLTSKVNIKVQVGGYFICEMDPAYGSFMVGSNDSTLVSDFLNKQNSEQIWFPLRKLTLKGTDVDITQIPESLSHLQLMFSQVGNGTAEAYNELVSRSKRLRSLHLAGNDWEIQNAQFDLKLAPKTLESLSLENFKIGYSAKPSFYNAVNVYFRNCAIGDPQFVKKIDTIFPRVEKFGITFSNENSNLCLPLLQTMLFSTIYPNYDTLDFIFVENCSWSLSENGNEDFAKIVNFLEDLEIKNNATVFVLEKREELSGRKISVVEAKRIRYDFQKWDKLESWSVFKNT